MDGNRLRGLALSAAALLLAAPGAWAQLTTDTFTADQVTGVTQHDGDPADGASTFTDAGNATGAPDDVFMTGTATEVLEGIIDVYRASFSTETGLTKAQQYSIQSITTRIHYRTSVSAATPLYRVDAWGDATGLPEANLNDYGFGFSVGAATPLNATDFPLIVDSDGGTTKISSMTITDFNLNDNYTFDDFFDDDGTFVGVIWAGAFVTDGIPNFDFRLDAIEVDIQYDPSFTGNSSVDFLFDSEADPEGWSELMSLSAPDVTGGRMYLDYIIPAPEDTFYPLMESPDELILDASQAKYLVMDVELNAAPGTEYTVWEIFFDTLDGENFVQGLTVKPFVGLRPVILDMSSHPNWTGLIQQIRIHPGGEDEREKFENSHVVFNQISVWDEATIAAFTTSPLEFTFETPDDVEGWQSIGPGTGAISQVSTPDGGALYVPLDDVEIFDPHIVNSYFYDTGNGVDTQTDQYLILDIDVRSRTQQPVIVEFFWNGGNGFGPEYQINFELVPNAGVQRVNVNIFDENNLWTEFARAGEYRLDVYGDSAALANDPPTGEYGLYLHRFKIGPAPEAPPAYGFTAGEDIPWEESFTRATEQFNLNANNYDLEENLVPDFATHTMTDTWFQNFGTQQNYDDLADNLAKFESDPNVQWVFDVAPFERDLALHFVMALMEHGLEKFNEAWVDLDPDAPGAVPAIADQSYVTLEGTLGDRADIDGDGIVNAGEPGSDGATYAANAIYNVASEPITDFAVDVGNVRQTLSPGYYDGSAEGSGLKVIGDPAAEGRFPLLQTISPDGKRIAFTSFPENLVPPFSLYVVKIGEPTSWKKLIDSDVGNINVPYWTPDSNFVVWNGLKVDIATGNAVPFMPRGLVVGETSFTNLPGSNTNWGIARVYTGFEYEVQMVAFPVTRTGDDDLTREPVGITRFFSDGGSVTDPVVAPDASAFMFRFVNDRGSGKLTYSHILLIPDLPAILNAPRESKVDIISDNGGDTNAANVDFSTIGPEAPLDPNIVLLRGGSYASKPSFSEDGSLVFFSEDVSNVFSESNVFGTIGVQDFDLFVMGTDPSVKPRHLPLADDQSLLEAAQGSIRLTFLRFENADGLFHLVANSLQVKQPVSGTTVGDPLDNIIATDTDQEVSDASGTNLEVATGTQIDFPDGEEQKLSIETPVDIVPEDAIATDPETNEPVVDAIPVVRTFGPAGTTFSPAIVVDITYEDAEVEGLSEESIRVFRYNDSTMKWDDEVPESDIVLRDTVNNVIKFKVAHFSSFGIGAKADTDADSIDDNVDTDDDGDGLDDATEDPSLLDTDNDGIVNADDTDDDGDGITDSVDPFLFDTDNDGIRNDVDTDDDGDGIDDGDESQTTDSDGDGIPDSLDTDSDGDGIDDVDEGTDDVDTDSTPNYLDDDSDGDGIDDMTEGSMDPDMDMTPSFLDLDSDGDGISDMDETADDYDGDTVPNYLDLDSDNDGFSDAAEAAAGSDPYDELNFIVLPTNVSPWALALALAFIGLALAWRRRSDSSA